MSCPQSAKPIWQGPQYLTALQNPKPSPIVDLSRKKLVPSEFLQMPLLGAMPKKALCTAEHLKIFEREDAVHVLCLARSFRDACTIVSGPLRRGPGSTSPESPEARPLFSRKEHAGGYRVSLQHAHGRLSTRAFRNPKPPSGRSERVSAAHARQNSKGCWG